MVFSEEQAWPGQAMLSFECSLGNSQKFRRNYSAGGSAVTWTQGYDPLGHWWLSTLVAALPVVVLLGALAVLRIKAHWAALLGLAASLVIAVGVFKMPAGMGARTAVYGACYGLFPIGWVIP